MTFIIDPCEWSSILEDCHKSCEFIAWLKQDSIRREANKAFYESRPHILRNQNNYSGSNMPSWHIKYDRQKQEEIDRELAMKLHNEELSIILARQVEKQ